MFLALGGGAYAAVSSAPASNVISGCYSKRTGLLRVLKAGQRCDKKAEVAISWNQKGIEGPPGPTGRPGPTGVAMGGATGPAGSPGATGATGTTGPAGTAAAYAIIRPYNSYVPILEAKNVIGLREQGGNPNDYCVDINPALGIDTNSVPAIVVADIGYSDVAGDYGLVAFAVPQQSNTSSGCGANAYHIHTEDNGTADNLVAFDIFVP